ncbi:MAG: hypothetical protein SGI74_05055 [Oligoflexia bacterium]|nr:hypothetical protein [Oligoflexia bacterium]
MILRVLLVSVLLVWSTLGFASDASINRCNGILKNLINDQKLRDRLLEQIKTSLNIQTGKGFVLLDTATQLSKEIFDPIFSSLEKGSFFKFTPSRENHQHQFRRGDDASKLKQITEVDNSFPKDFISFVFDHGKWIESLLNQALKPHEQYVIDYVEVRTQDGKVGLPWNSAGQITHEDGGYLTVTTAVIGSGTIFTEHSNSIYDKSPYKYTQVLRGQTLIITGLERAEKFPQNRATLHHAPEEKQDRLLFLVRFKPRR